MLKIFYIRAIAVLLLSTCFAFSAQSQAKTVLQKKAAGAPKQAGKPAAPKPKEGPVRIRIMTDSGTIIVKLSDSTPLHRDNFVKLVKGGFYDSLMFHRVIPAFMIQGGDPTSKNASQGIQLGGGGADMTRIPAEFKPSLYHKKGALAAARDGNPEKASSACQFYIVEGKLYTDDQLNMLEQRGGFKYSPEQREMYKTVGGTPQLDQGYTVFGEVESGLEVIGKISHAERDGVNRPLGDVRMKMELLK